jgi:hypothetical protein
VAKSSTGKWVSRVGASGGGKAYKKSRPSNYYGVLAIIVILGLAMTVYSRYEYQNPSVATTTAAGVPPVIGTNWYEAMNVDACGVNYPLTPDTTTQLGFTIGANNVLHVAPVSATETGSKATLALFVTEHHGIVATSSSLALPTPTGIANNATTWKNGDVCGPKTKYAGKTGTVQYAYWMFGQTKPTVVTDPAKVPFSANQMYVTMAFLPSGVTPSKPSAETIVAMSKSIQAAASTTTTTSPSGSLSTIPVGSTVIPGSSTTILPTTTTPKG